MSEQLPEQLTENPKRAERTQRILDVASDLIVRFGYKKTTIDDIARHAHIAKGTIYLHWKSREELFIALVMRETLLASKEVLELLLQDAEGIFLHTITKHAFAIALQRPLVRALLTEDREILGELAHLLPEQVPSYYERRLSASRKLMALLRNYRLIRTDQSIDEQLQIYNAIVIGFLSVNQYLPGELELLPERSADLLADVIQHTFAVSESSDPPQMSEVSQQLQEIFQSVLDELQKRVQASQ